VTHRFSVLPYANASPLVHFIGESPPEVSLSYHPPRHSVAALLDGQADAALIPIVDFFTHRELRMVPGLGICADGDVTSVLLQCQRPLPTVTTIGLDPESKTSNVLVRVLARDHFPLSRGVEFTHGIAKTQASVCIGDRALRAAPALESYDLAGEWKKMTGLPFVFAVWVVHRSCPCVEEISQLLRQAKNRGCESRRQLAGLCSRRLGLPEDRCYDYLAHRLHYDMGPGDVEGMSLFRELATEFLPRAGGRQVRQVSDPPGKEDTPVLELT